MKLWQFVLQSVAFVLAVLSLPFLLLWELRK